MKTWQKKRAEPYIEKIKNDAAYEESHNFVNFKVSFKTKNGWLIMHQVQINRNMS